MEIQTFIIIEIEKEIMKHAQDTHNRRRTLHKKNGLVCETSFDTALKGRAGKREGESQSTSDSAHARNKARERGGESKHV